MSEPSVVRATSTGVCVQSSSRNQSCPTTCMPDSRACARLGPWTLVSGRGQSRTEPLLRPFGTLRTSGTPRCRSAGAVEAWLLGKLRLFLEWLTVPMLLVALQLPHASLVYWLSSGLATLGQQSLLRLPHVRCRRACIGCYRASTVDVYPVATLAYPTYYVPWPPQSMLQASRRTAYCSGAG
jgi:hypothetical protein